MTTTYCTIGTRIEVLWCRQAGHTSLVLKVFYRYSSVQLSERKAEQKPRLAVELLNELRDIAKKRKVAFLLIHQIKKPSENGVPALEDLPAMTWLLQACGARALVNQSDVRIAFDRASAVNAHEAIGPGCGRSASGWESFASLRRVADIFCASGMRSMTVTSPIPTPRRLVAVGPRRG